MRQNWPRINDRPRGRPKIPLTQGQKIDPGPFLGKSRPKYSPLPLFSPPSQEASQALA
jgi:hypothetical protein